MESYRRSQMEKYRCLAPTSTISPTPYWLALLLRPVISASPLFPILATNLLVQTVHISSHFSMLLFVHLVTLPAFIVVKMYSSGRPNSHCTTFCNTSKIIHHSGSYFVYTSTRVLSWWNLYCSILCLSQFRLRTPGKAKNYILLIFLVPSTAQHTQL